LTKRLLTILDSHPDRPVFIEALRIILSFVAMDVMPQVVFAGDAVLWAFLGTSHLEERTRDYLRSVIEMTVPYIHIESLSSRGLSFSDMEKTFALRAIRSDELASLIAESDFVFAF